MHITRLLLQDVRRFHKQEFILHSGFNLMVGENGAGKSTVLRSLVAALTPSGSSPQPLLEDEDVRLAGDVLQVTVTLGSAANVSEGTVTYRRRIGQRALRKGVTGAPPVLTYSSNEATCRAFVSRRAKKVSESQLDVGRAAEEWLFTQHSTATMEASAQRFGDIDAVRRFVVRMLTAFSDRFTDFAWTFEPFACKLLIPKGPGAPDPKSRRAFQNAILRELQRRGNPLSGIDTPTVVLQSDGRIANGKESIVPPFDEIAKQLKLSNDDMTVFGSRSAEVRLTPRIRVLERSGRVFLLSQLSDGEQRLFSLFVDIARRLSLIAGTPNALQLEGSAVILIDEIDVHLHPKWQRRIVPTLGELFPRCQFIATTHSPFVIQSLPADSSVKLINLDDPQATSFVNRSIEDISEEIQGVEVPQRSERWLKMLEAAEKYYQVLRQARGESPERLRELKNRLDELSERFSDDPAYQALLRSERVESRIDEES